MGDVAVTLRILPEDSDVDIKSVEENVRGTIGGICNLASVETVEIAFGLKALKIQIIIPDADGEIDKIEGKLSSIGSFVGDEIVMARDNRLSGNMIEYAVRSGILSTGCNVIDVGVIPTPGLQYYCKTRKLFGVMITASHNPPQFNGIKCIDSDGTELGRKGEDEIEKIYRAGRFNVEKWTSVGRCFNDNTAKAIYIEGILKNVNLEKIRGSNFRVAFDAGNGASFSTTPDLLSRMGMR